MKRFMLAMTMFTAAAAALAPAEAKADAYVYACSVRHETAQYFGEHGGIRVTYYTEPFCGGSYRYSRYYCSDNSTTYACTGDTRYLYSESGLSSLFDALADAVREGQRVYEYAYYCRNSTSPSGGGYSCGRSVDFYAD